MPRRCESFILGVGHDPVVAELDDAEGIRLATDVGRSQALSLEDLHHQVANVFQLVKCVWQLLCVSNVKFRIVVSKKRLINIFKKKHNHLTAPFSVNKCCKEK